MSHSSDERRKNIELAFQLMMGELGEHGINELRFDIDEPPYEIIYPTTWQYLEDQYFTKRYDTMGERHCFLTGYGWMEGLRIAGSLETTEMKEKVGRVMAEIKKLVEGRGEKAFEYVKAVAGGAVVSQGFAYNIIEGGYIETVLHRKGVEWASRAQGLMIEIPVDFGMEFL